jgi:hypothetical protein
VLLSFCCHFEPVALLTALCRCPSRAEHPPRRARIARAPAAAARLDRPTPRSGHAARTPSVTMQVCIVVAGPRSDPQGWEPGFKGLGKKNQRDCPKGQVLIAA